MPQRHHRGMRPWSKRLAACALGLAGAVHAAAADPADPAVASMPFPAQFVDAQPVLDAIAAARPIELGGAAVTGLVLPHHRVAADLIATGLVSAAQGPAPERIVLLTPDHFKRSPRAFASTLRDFDTALGRVPIDRAAVQQLLRSPEVSASILFEREHGIGELLPYIARLFPGVPLVPVAVRIGAGREQWDRLVDRLAPLVTSRTLIIQSTDFSHYLPREQAVRHDQQMLDIIAAGDFGGVARARQPAQLDSRGAQYIQMRLQKRVFGAEPIVYGNRNSADGGPFGATDADSTTSCIARI
jgi:poly-gamma-glutamate synthesis protein (capsule biosynthesis protein)